MYIPGASLSSPISLRAAVDGYVSRRLGHVPLHLDVLRLPANMSGVVRCLNAQHEVDFWPKRFFDPEGQIRR